MTSPRENGKKHVNTESTPIEAQSAPTLSTLVCVHLSSSAGSARLPSLSLYETGKACQLLGDPTAICARFYLRAKFVFICDCS